MRFAISKENMSSSENTTQLPELVDQAVETHEKKSPQESFAELRRQKDEIERQLWQAKTEKDFYEKQLQQQQRPTPQPIEEEFDFRELEKDEFPDGKKVSKAIGSINKKFSHYDQKLSQKEQEIKMLKTAVEYPDFKSVVTPENIEKYIKSDEDNREAVEKAENPLRKCYNLIKKELARVPKEAPISQEQKRVDEKVGKPQLGSLGVRSEAVTAAAKLTNSTMTREQRNALWKETLAAARR